MLKRFWSRMVYYLKSLLCRFDAFRSYMTGFRHLRWETYIRMIRNSKRTKMFCSFVAMENDSGKVVDILRDGECSCAFFVSGVLYLCQIVTDRIRTTVRGLREMLSYSSDWEVVDLGSGARLGDIVFWERIWFEDGTSNEHVGFALSKSEAMSTSSTEKAVVRHHITYGMKSGAEGVPIPARKITHIFRYKGG